MSRQCLWAEAALLQPLRQLQQPWHLQQLRQPRSASHAPRACESRGQPGEAAGKGHGPCAGSTHGYAHRSLTASSSRALHCSALGITGSPDSTRTREQAPASLLPIPGCGHGSKGQNPISSLCTSALTPRGYGKESSLWERGRSTTRGDHLFRENFILLTTYCLGT